MDRGLNFNSEQLEVIHSSGDARINAVAGSGKTSTLVAYAAAHPQLSMLFLSFNRSTALDAKRKFQAARCRNVQVETVHSLAFKELRVGQRAHGLLPGGTLTLKDIVSLCDLERKYRGIERMVVAKHIQRFFALFCNSPETCPNRFDYLASVTDPAIQTSILKYEADIYNYSRVLFDKMRGGLVGLTHDVYLKLYQIFQPFFPYDVVLVDEAQDLSPVTVEILKCQNQCARVIVGDTHQQIYGFRSAVNSLESFDFKCFSLSHSYRFTAAIANLALEALSYKRYLGQYTPPVIVGLGSGVGKGGQAVIARTNIELLGAAIDTLADNGDCTFFFEGGLKGYSFMSDGASLVDILSLSMSKHDNVRSGFLRQFSSLGAFEEYIAASGDQELGIGLRLVKKYGSDLADFLASLQRMSRERDVADLVFATLHKAKGAEYDIVSLVGDGFISEARLLNQIRRCRLQGKTLDKSSTTEEINALYVAITRARLKLNHGFSIGSLPPCKECE